ncbi:MAG: helix-hairpin-helix domain-containing protein [Candidatus Heimdallarchaeaceae archaeon]
MRSPRRSLIGSYRYSVVIKPETREFSDSMSGLLELYDGKHIVETHKFASFDQLATNIIAYWEKKLGSDVNVHRFSNWLSEYFSDIGITNINFYQMLETVRGMGKGVSLQSSGVAVREAKVIQEYLGDTEAATAKEVELKPAGTFIDVRGEGMDPEQEKLRPEEPPTETVIKPSEIFKTDETVSPVVTHLPIQKEEEKIEKPAPPTNALLKPSEVLKERDSVVFVDEDEPIARSQVSGDPVVTTPQEKTVKLEPPTDNLLKPSEYLKQRDIIDVIFKTPIEPTTIPEEKKTEFVAETSFTQQKLGPPSEKLLKPREYLQEMEIEAKEEIDLLEEPSEKIAKPDKEIVIPSTTIDPDVQKIPTPPISGKTEERVSAPKVGKTVKEIIDFGIEVKEEDEPLAVTFREINTIEDLRVTDIMGVGDKTAMILKNGGFDEIQKIMETTPEKLSKVPGIGITSAKQLIYGSKALMKKGLEILAAKSKAARGTDEHDITDISGVGKKTAMLLKEGGYETVEKMIETTPEKLSKIPGIGLATARKLILASKALLGEDSKG